MEYMQIILSHLGFRCRFEKRALSVGNVRGRSASLLGTQTVREKSELY